MDIGIDLGTTFSVLAVNGEVELRDDYPDGIYLPECDVTIIPTPDGEATFPSVTVEDPEQPGTYIFGREAAQKAEEGLAPAMFSKRKIGTKETFEMRSGPLTAADIAREFLAFLKQCAENALGQKVARAVITHPAYFDRSAVEETRQAAIAAGFDMSQPEQMLMEPVAAALAYTRGDARDPLRVITYDLGGGTFDVTYLERSGGVIDMRAFDGDHLMGGYNFDREIANWVLRQLESKGRNILLDESDEASRGRLAQLLQLAESFKIDLANAATDATRVDFRSRDTLVDSAGKPVQVNERLTREEFVAMIDPYLERTLQSCRRTLEKADIQPDSVDEVLLVGGSTKAPWISKGLKSMFPNVDPKLFQPDLCVAAGAAIHAKLVLPAQIDLGGYKLSLDAADDSVLNIISISGRIEVPGGNSGAGSHTIILKRAGTASAGPLMPTDDGDFLFEEIELEENGTTALAIEIRNEADEVVLEHAFAIRHAPEDTETSTVTTVLPRPLHLLTHNGLVPLVKEGATLPARFENTFDKANDNSNVNLELYQDDQLIGEVRIEDIPAEAGRGSFIDLSIEVTDGNVIRGQAVVRTKQGQVVARVDVHVEFSVPEIPDEENLRTQWADIQSRHEVWRVDHSTSPHHAVDVKQVAEWVRFVERLFEQRPLERQEAHHFLSRIAKVMNPTADTMSPTWAEFCAQTERCRRLLEDPVAEDDENAAPAETENSQKATTSPEQARHFIALLEQLVEQGRELHGRRDYKAWAELNDHLRHVESEVSPNIDFDIPTPKMKMVAAFAVLEVLEQLRAKAANVAEKGRSADWEKEIARIENTLVAVLQETQDVDDNLPSAQSLAQMRLIYAKKVVPIREAISRLGIDVSKLAM